MTVMIIDDSRIQRNIIKSYLSEVSTVKWTFFEAADGHEGLQLVEKVIVKNDGKLDLILLDWNMPNMTGIEFLKELRSETRFDDVKVIMVTSDGNKSHVLEAIKCGVSNFVLKPVNTQSLIEKIESLYEHRLPSS